MFKSSRKRENRFNFEEELNQKLNLIKQQTPVKETNLKRNREMAIILDQAVEELATPKENSPKESFHVTYNQKAGQIREMASLQLDENSSISLNSRQDHFEHQPKKIQTKDHISYLVSHPEVIKLLIEIYPYCSEKERLTFSDFVRKIYQYYYGITIKEEEMATLKEKLKIELTTTDPEYLSLNALEIIAKRHKLIVYFMSFYISTKIQIKIGEYQKKNKRMMLDLKERQERLKECEERLSADEEEYSRKYTSLAGKEKAFSSKVKEFNQRQKQLRKSIQEKTAKLYETYLGQFNQKIKQTEKRLNNNQKNLKYKIEILQRRSQTLKQLINQKNDMKNKKVMGQNEAKIRLRKMEKEMQQVQKKYQNQIELLQKEEKEMMKSYSLLEERMAKVEKKASKYKERVGQLEEELALANEEHQKVITQRIYLEQRLHHLEQQPLKTSNNEENAIKIIKQKTSRSAKNKKKAKSSDHSQIITLYQCLLQCQSRQQAISHSKQQQLIQIMMKNTVKELPTLINLPSSNQQEEDLPKEPHYLVLNTTKLLLKEFYLLNPTQQPSKHNESKLRSTDIQQLLKYPYRSQTRFSIFFLFLEIYDWTETSSACFFSKTIQVLIEELDSQSFLTNKTLIANQMQLLTSSECIFFLAMNFYALEEMDKDSQIYENRLIISIAVTDLLIHLVKAQQDSIFDQLLERDIQKTITKVLMTVLRTIMQVYGSQKIKGKNIVLFACIESLQELAEKLSILLQRIHYKYSKQLQQSTTSSTFKTTCLSFLQLNRSTANRHSLITANLNSILNFTTP